MGGLDPTRHKKKKTNIETGLDLDLKPSQPNFLWAKDVFGKTHPYAISL
jgi:hypothetical protein